MATISDNRRDALSHDITASSGEEQRCGPGLSRWPLLIWLIDVLAVWGVGVYRLWDISGPVGRMVITVATVALLAAVAIFIARRIGGRSPRQESLTKVELPPEGRTEWT